MHLRCLNTRAYCVSAIAYDGFVFCNLAITSRNYNSRFNPNELYIAKGEKKIKLAHHCSEFLNYLWNPDFIVLGSETVRHVLYGEIQKKKNYNIMIVVPVHPMGQRKRQDDVLSFQKNHRISLPFYCLFVTFKR